MRHETLDLRSAAEEFVAAKEKRRLMDGGGGALEREAVRTLNLAERRLAAAAVKFTQLGGKP